MPIPGNAEPGVFSAQHEVQLQHSIYLSKAIPIKKRRFPVIPAPSPPIEKCSSFVGSCSKNEQESNILDHGSSLSDARFAASHGNSELKNEAVSSTNVELGQSNVENFASKIPNDGLSSSSGRDTVSPGNSALNKTTPTFMVKDEKVNCTNIGNSVVSKPFEAKAPVDASSLSGSSSKLNMLCNKEPAEPRVPVNFMSTETRNVKQEILAERVEGVSKVQESTPSPMNIELSLGFKEPVAPVLGCQDSGNIHHESEMSQPLLSLGLAKEKHILHYNNDITTGTVSSVVCANWDLNTTMDVWEGSSNGHALDSRFSKADSCSDGKSSLTIDGTDGLSSDRTKHNLNDQTPTYYSSLKPFHLFTTNDSPGLKLAMPLKELGACRESFTLTKIVSTSGMQLPSGNVNMSMKSEPIEENLNHDSGISSCNSSTMGLLKLSSLKRELVDDSNLGTALQPSVRPGKSAGHKAIKSEVAELGNKVASISDDAMLTQSVARVMQHRENSASSSALPVPLMPQNPCSSRLPTCSESTAVADSSVHSERSFQNKEFHDHNDNCGEQVDHVVSEPFRLDDRCSDLYKGGEPDLGYPESCNLARVDDRQSGGKAANAEEKIILAEMSEGASLGSNCEFKENCDIGTPKVIGENVAGAEGGEYEDGEFRELVQPSAVEDPIIEENKFANSKSVNWEPQNLMSSVLLGDLNINNPDFEEKFTAEENRREIHCGPVEDCLSISWEPNCEDSSLRLKPNNLLELVTDENRPIDDPLGKTIAPGREIIENNPKVFCGEPTNGSHCIDSELCDEATDKVVDDIFSGESASTLAKAETLLSGHDTAKESNSTGSKSRIISLPRTPVMTAPGITKSLPEKSPTPRSGKERDSDVDEKIQPRENSLFYKDEIYPRGPNKFVKDRVFEPSLRNSRSSFTSGKGRVAGWFGPLHGEWDSVHEFVSKNYNGPPGYRVDRRKHSSNNSDVDLEFNGYVIPRDDTALVGSRRKVVNGEFTSTRHNSFRRLSPGDRDGTVPRGSLMNHRNMSPSQCTVENGSNVVRHVNKFMRRISDDIVEPMYDLPQAMHVQGSRNFSGMHRKGYPRIRSKSPVGSPGQWQSFRRRSPVEPPELIEHRSPGMYRVGRMRSPERICYHDDEMFARRQPSPSYMGRHANELNDMDSGCGHVHPRSTNSNRRTSPGHVFPSEMGEGDEFIINGPMHSNKFHEVHRGGNIGERRKFFKRGGPHSFHSNYNRGENDNFHLHRNDGPRQYRFSPDMEPEFVERSSIRERELEARVKHQPMVAPRRVRNIEDQPNENYRPPVGCGWHDDGFTNSRAKRKRF